MEECGDTEHGIHPRGHVIPQPIVVLCVLDGGNEHNTLPGVQVQVDLQHRRPGLPGNLIRIQVCCHVTQAHQHHLPQSCDDDVADKVHVGLPVRQPLAHAQPAVGVLEKLRNGAPALRDFLVLRRALLFHEADPSVARHGLGTASDQRLHRPAVQQLLDGLQVVRHLGQQLRRELHSVHGLRDEQVRAVALPVEVAQARCQRLVHLVQVLLHQRPLDRQQLLLDAVVHIDDQVQVASMLAERLRLLVNRERRVGDAEPKQQEVLDLSEQPHQRRVEVDLQQRRVRGVALDERQLQLLLAAGLNVLAPLLDLVVLKLGKACHEGGVGLHDLLSFVTGQQGPVQCLQLLHRQLDSAQQPTAPAQCTGDGRQVVGNRRATSTVGEHGLHLGQVLRVTGQQCMLLPLQLVLDMVALEHAFKAVQQLESTDDGRHIVEALRQDGGNTTLQLLDAEPELVEVVVETLRVDVQDVVLDGLELLHRRLEILVHLMHRRGQRLALCASDLDLGELGKLDDGVGELADVVAALQEAVQP